MLTVAVLARVPGLTLPFLWYAALSGKTARSPDTVTVRWSLTLMV
jgi:hypothetical protein